MLSKKNVFYGLVTLLTGSVVVALYKYYKREEEEIEKEVVDEHPERSIGDTEVETKEYVTSEQLTDESCGSVISVQHEIKTSASWYKLDGSVVITDPSGWLDVEDPEEYWNNKKIMHEEYLVRRNLSSYSSLHEGEGEKEDPIFVTL
jgi:hypothetical protein